MAFSSSSLEFHSDSLEGASAAAEWLELGTFQVDGSELTLSTATALLKVKAVRRSQKHCKFEAVFDKKKLVACGFHERIDLENIAKIIDSALRGDHSFSARIDANGDSVKLKMTQTIGLFTTVYTLPLNHKSLHTTDSLRAELAKHRTDSEATIAELLQIIEKITGEKQKLEVQNENLKYLLKAADQIMSRKKAPIAEVTNESFVVYRATDDVAVKSVGRKLLHINAGKQKTILVGSSVQWNTGICSYTVTIKEKLKKTFAFGLIGDVQQCLIPRMYLTHERLATDTYLVQCYVRRSKGPSYFVMRNFRDAPRLKLTKKSAPLSVGAQITITMDFDRNTIEFVVDGALVAATEVTSTCTVWHPAIDVDVAIDVDIS